MYAILLKSDFEYICYKTMSMKLFSNHVEKDFSSVIIIRKLIFYK